MSRKTILSFGEVLWDLLPDGAVLGGAPCNFAFRMQSFGHRSIMVSRLGKDLNGNKARDILTKLDLPVEGIQSDQEHPTGTVKVTLDHERNPDYFIVPDVAYDHIEFSPYLKDLVNHVDALYFGTLAQRSSKSQKTLHRLLDQLVPDTLKICDINLRKNCYNKAIIEKSLSQANILKLSHEETGKIANFFSLNPTNLIEMGEQLVDRWNLTCCLITLGPKGALAFDKKGNCVYQPGYCIKLKEPVGAGDACTAGFTHRFLSGASLKECCQTGCAIGALVATHAGATEIVTPQALESLMRSNKDFQIDSRYKHLLN